VPEMFPWLYPFHRERSRERSGVDDGARTHDRRNHNPELYQLSYAHHSVTSLSFQPAQVARLAGLEPATYGLEGRCSIRLSYRRVVHQPDRVPRKRDVGRGRRIRTADPLLPKQMRYQTAPCPDLRKPESLLPFTPRPRSALIGTAILGNPCGMRKHESQKYRQSRLILLLRRRPCDNTPRFNEVLRRLCPHRLLMVKKSPPRYARR
jgi:hypothetical protein